MDRTTLCVDVLTLFPELLAPAFNGSILGRAQRAGLLAVRLVQLRDFAVDRHLMVDDEPYGGGAGMLLKPEPVVRALRDLRRPDSVTVLLAAQGRRFDQRLAEELACERHLVVVCGHYEGFDDRVRHFVDREVSVGDFVVTGGEPIAWTLVDAVARLRQGVLKGRSLDEESFTAGTLEASQFTRPSCYQGIEVPPLLRSGDHGRITAYRRQQAFDRTQRLRPDLLAEGIDRKGGEH